MRTIVFGCPHVTDRPGVAGAALVPTVQWLVQQVQALQADMVVCLGDTVESSSRTTVPVNVTVKWFLECFKQLAAGGTQVYWLIGNHDIYSSELHTLQVFDEAPNFHIVSKPLLAEGPEGWKLGFMPYTQEMDQSTYFEGDNLAWADPAKGSPAVLFSHVPLSGWQLGEIKDRGLDPVELALRFSLVFQGHYHQSAFFEQEGLGALTKVIAPGCVLGRNFRDLGWFHGIVVWDTPDTVHWVTNPHSHSFMVGSSAELNAILADERYHPTLDRLHVRLTDQVEVEPYRERLAAIEVRPRPQAQTPSGREGYALESNPEADLRRWLADKVPPEALDTFIQKGMKYLDKAASV